MVRSIAIKPYVDTMLRPQVEGIGNVISLTTPAVFVANHSSHLDTPLIVGALPSRFGSRLAVGAAADYFFASRLTGATTALLFNAFPVRRGAAPEALSTAKCLLASGWSVLLYPEGTRSGDGNLGNFKTGAARLSLETGLPVLPIAVSGTQYVIPRGKRLPARAQRPLSVRFGPPMSPATGETPQILRNRMRENMQQLRGESGASSQPLGQVGGENQVVTDRMRE
ncbi:lysophospholipid acyltransferase family protein [Streptomyces sp. NPDC000070]|uniref:lysophospholipid acyltransferase family protein n=1 Tax=Streptomyces sp. NPDC000070 TaxID=3154240 RepID=UPI00331DACC8